MSYAPRFIGTAQMPYGLSHALIHTAEQRVVALFTSKTLCDKACNEFNATLGGGKDMYSVARIFGD